MALAHRLSEEVGATIFGFDQRMKAFEVKPVTFMTLFSKEKDFYPRFAKKIEK